MGCVGPLCVCARQSRKTADQPLIRSMLSCACWRLLRLRIDPSSLACNQPHDAEGGEEEHQEGGQEAEGHQEGGEEDHEEGEEGLAEEVNVASLNLRGSIPTGASRRHRPCIPQPLPRLIRHCLASGLVFQDGSLHGAFLSFHGLFMQDRSVSLAHDKCRDSTRRCSRSWKYFH